MHTNNQDRLIAKLSRLWKDQQAHLLIEQAIQALETRYGLNKKIVNEPGVEEIIIQMFSRLSDSLETLSAIPGKEILDIACGSSTSQAPTLLYVNTPFGEKTIGSGSKGYTAQFEPWFCRILFELGAHAVGIDFGDLDRELFTHYRVDLGVIGALDFLPKCSFDIVQDSRLFGSPEFTAQFPKSS